MKTRIIAIVIVLIVGVTGAAAVLTLNKKNATPPQVVSNTSVAAPQHDVSMTNMLTAQTGDAYDKMFITMMSEHHAGAIAMAKLVVNDAKHPELRTFAQGIIMAQTKEVADMKAWAATWGYTYTAPSQSAIDDMVLSMKDKIGDALDKQFLTDMIGHHQSAVDMAVLSATRAKHEEIKILSGNIMSTQTTEIAKMQGFGSEWGYDVTATSTHSSHSSMSM